MKYEDVSAKEASGAGTMISDGVSRRREMNGGDRVERSLLQLKKRALNDHTSSGSGDPPHSSSSDDLSPPKKRWLSERKDDEYAQQQGREAEAPVRSHKHKPRSAKGKTPKQIKPQRSAKGKKPKPPSTAQLWLRKGKTKAERETASSAAVMMHGGGGGGNEDQPVLSEEVRAWLARLGATTRPLEFVFSKQLEKSDVCKVQNRLLVSCKRGGLEGSSITGFFSAEELRRVEDVRAGLLVTALDREGRWHGLTCKFLGSNDGYRFISGWSDLLAANGLVLNRGGEWTRDVDVELWAFRSPTLLTQPALGLDGKPVVVYGGSKDNKEPVDVVLVDDHLHDEGSLGLIVLHREHYGRRRVEQEDERRIQNKKKNNNKKKGTTDKPRENNRAARGGGGGAHAGRDDDGNKMQQGDAAPGAMSRDEMVARFGVRMTDAAFGLMALRDALSRERQQNVEPGCAAA